MPTPPASLHAFSDLQPPFSDLVAAALPRLREAHAATSKRGQRGRPGGLVGLIAANPGVQYRLGDADLARPYVGVVDGGRARTVLGPVLLYVGAERDSRHAAPLGAVPEVVERMMAQLRLPPVRGRLRTVLVAREAVFVVDVDLAQPTDAPAAVG